MNPVDTGPIQDNGTQVVTPTAPGSVLPPAPQSMAGPAVLAPAPPAAVAPAAVQPPPSVSLAVPPPINRPAPAVSLTSPVVSPPAPKPSWLHFNRIAFWVSGAAVLLIIAIAAVSFVLLNSHTPAGQTNSNYGVTSLPLQNAQADAGQLLGKASKLDVNGQLRVNDTLVLTPGSKPSSPVAGQLYYDKSTNQPYYYNGINFVALTGAAASGASQNVSQPNITQITQIQGSSGSGAATCAYGACVSLQAGAPGVAQTGNVNVAGAVTAGQLNAGSVNAGSYNVNGSPLASGNLADAANIALLNRSGQTFSGSNTFTGSLTVRDAVNSTTAFQVQNSADSSLLTADTLDQSVIVGNLTGVHLLPGIDTSANLTTGQWPAGEATANLCNNGRADLAVANNTSGTVSIYCNNGGASGTAAYAASATMTLTVGSEPYGLTVGDFCNNGRSNDLAVANSNDDTLSVYCNTGSAGTAAYGSSAAMTLPTGEAPYAVTSGNFCNNGRTDLAVADADDQTADIYCNTGASGSSAYNAAGPDITLNTGYYSYDITAGNFCNNGRADLAVTNISGRTTTVYCNTGSPGTAAFAADPTITLTGAPGPTKIAAGDFCNNGLADLAVTDNNDLSVYCNTGASGAGAFTGSITENLPTGTYATGVTTASLCGNGRADLAVTNWGANTASVYCNTGVAGEDAYDDTADITVNTGNEPYGIIAGNFCNNGLSNLAISNNEDNDVSIYCNAPAASAAAAASLIVAPAASTGEQIYVSPSQTSALNIVDVTSGSLLDRFAANGDLTVNGSNTGAGAFGVATGDDPVGIAISDNDAYVVNYDDNDMQVFDISNPTDITQIGNNIATDEWPSGIAISGNYAYVPNRNGTLQIFDISDPSNITEVSDTTTTGDCSFGIAISGNDAYIPDECDNNMQVFDISNPDNVTQVGSDIPTGNWPAGVAISGNDAYVINYNDNDIQIFNISDPTDITQVGGTVAAGNRPAGIAISGNDAYVADDNGSLTTLNIADPDNVTVVGNTTTAADGCSSGIAISGNDAYILDECSNTMGVLDISNPASPQAVANQPALQINGAASFQNMLDSSDAFQILDAEGNSLFSADTANDTLSLGAIQDSPNSSSADALQINDPYGNDLFDVSNDDEVDVNTSLNAYDGLQVTGDTSVSSDSTTAFEVQNYAGGGSTLNVDTLDQEVGVNGTLTVSAPGAAATQTVNTSYDVANTGIAISVNYAYVLGQSDGGTLDVYNISNPDTASFASGYSDFGDYPDGIAISGNYAYVIDNGSNTLRVFNNASNPGYMTQVDNVATGAWPVSIAISGDYAYVVNNNSSDFQVFNISNPASVTQVGGNVATYSAPQSIAISGDYAYVVTSNTMQVFDISNPASITPVGSIIATGINSSDIAISGDYAYVVNVGDPSEGSNFQVFNISNPASVTQVGSNVATEIHPYSIAISGNYAYVMGGVGSPGTLQAFNISNPANISLVGTGSTAGTPVDGSNILAISGDYIYDMLSSDVQVFSTSSLNSSNPLLQVGNAAGTGNTFSVDASGTAVFQSATNSTTAFQVQNASGVDVFNVDTSNGRVGINTTAPANLLSIGALTTASPGAQIAVSTGGATNSGIVVQTVTSQSSGYVFQAQDSTGATLASIDYQGNLVVKSATIDGHIITGNASGTTTATLQSAAGTGGSPACTVTGDDTAGLITLTTGTAGWAAGAQCTINFSADYAAAPHPVITPTATTNVTAVTPTVTATTGGFTVNFINADTAQHTYTWDYFNAQ